MEGVDTMSYAKRIRIKKEWNRIINRLHHLRKFLRVLNEQIRMRQEIWESEQKIAEDKRMNRI